MYVCAYVCIYVFMYLFVYVCPWASSPDPAKEAGRATGCCKRSCLFAAVCAGAMLIFSICACHPCAGAMLIFSAAACAGVH